jgi:hypothetical protein
VQAAVEIAGRASDLFFRVSEGSPPAGIIAFLAAYLLPAMDIKGTVRIAGALERCQAFASPLTSDAVAGIRIRSDLVLRHHEGNLRALEESGLDLELGRALRHCIGRYRAHRFRAEMDRGLAAHGAAYAWWICSSLAVRWLRRLSGRGRR